jgi:mannan endo-1,4-beta-mannosidase
MGVSVLKKFIKQGLCILCFVCLGASGCGVSKRNISDAENAAAVAAETVNEDDAEEDVSLSQNGADIDGEAKNNATGLYDGKLAVYEAEEAKLIGGARIESKEAGFSGTGYVTGFENEGDACAFTVTVKEAGFYDLNFITSTGKHGYKENNIYIDGAALGVVSAESDGFTNSVITRIYLEHGEHKVLYEKYWGWMYLDRLEVTASKPVNPELFNI